jgi:hypothetical protein
MNPARIHAPTITLVQGWLIRCCSVMPYCASVGKCRLLICIRPMSRLPSLLTLRAVGLRPDSTLAMA